MVATVRAVCRSPPPHNLKSIGSEAAGIGMMRRADSMEDLNLAGVRARQMRFTGPLNSLFSARHAEVVEATAREKLLDAHKAQERARNRELEALEKLEKEA
ncbi:MAG: hypothetical protein SGPRY_002845 [Prymnesium sp.]